MDAVLSQAKDFCGVAGACAVMFLTAMQTSFTVMNLETRRWHWPRDLYVACESSVHQRLRGNDVQVSKCYPMVVDKATSLQLPDTLTLIASGLLSIVGSWKWVLLPQLKYWQPWCVSRHHLSAKFTACAQCTHFRLVSRRISEELMIAFPSVPAK